MTARISVFIFTSLFRFTDAVMKFLANCLMGDSFDWRWFKACKLKQDLCFILTYQFTCSQQNPDGSLQRAAMTQSALAKERRELKQAQREAQADSIPKDLGKLWIDPIPDGEC